MKTRHLLVFCLSLLLTGCSTLSSLSDVKWSKAYPWNWFGSSLEMSEQGLGDITATSPLDEETVSDALGGSYRVRSGMKMENGHIVRFYEGLKDDKVELVIVGDKTGASRISTSDSSIESASGVEIGTPFHTLYSKAYGSCSRAPGDDSQLVACKAPGSQHLSYLFGGEWRGPEGLIPSDDTLKNWTLKKIVWQR